MEQLHYFLAGNSERSRQCHLALSSSQLDRRIRLILSGHGASHIIKGLCSHHQSSTHLKSTQMSTRSPASPSDVKDTVRRKTKVSEGRGPKLCLNFLTIVVKCDAIFFDTKRQPRPFAGYIRHSEFKKSFRPCIVCMNQADCGVFCERPTSNLEP